MKIVVCKYTFQGKVKQKVLQRTSGFNILGNARQLFPFGSDIPVWCNLMN
jgi:hypothetical protein